MLWDPKYYCLASVVRRSLPFVNDGLELAWREWLYIRSVRNLKVSGKGALSASGVWRGVQCEPLRARWWDRIVQFSPSVVSDSLWPRDCSTPGFPVQHQLPEFTQTHSCPLSWWCLPTISSSVVPFYSSLQYFSESGSFQMSQFFTSGGQRIGVSVWTSVLPVNIQDWSPLGWTGWISLQAKGLSRVFSNTAVQKHQFFSPQLSL